MLDSVTPLHMRNHQLRFRLAQPVPVHARFARDLHFHVTGQFQLHLYAKHSINKNRSTTGKLSTFNCCYFSDSLIKAS
jgi:hypothetical protein